jgi:hypothetical protein
LFHWGRAQAFSISAIVFDKIVGDADIAKNRYINLTAFRWKKP